MKKDWVSLSRAAKIIGISFPTACRARDNGHLQCIKVGGIYRVYRVEIERYMREGNRVLPGIPNEVKDGSTNTT